MAIPTLHRHISSVANLPSEQSRKQRPADFKLIFVNGLSLEIDADFAFDVRRSDEPFEADRQFFRLWMKPTESLNHLIHIELNFECERVCIVAERCVAPAHIQLFT